jgi:hypothetical protein
MSAFNPDPFFVDLDFIEFLEDGNFNNNFFSIGGHNFKGLYDFT